MRIDEGAESLQGLAGEEVGFLSLLGLSVLDKQVIPNVIDMSR